MYMYVKHQTEGNCYFVFIFVLPIAEDPTQSQCSLPSFPPSPPNGSLFWIFLYLFVCFCVDMYLNIGNRALSEGFFSPQMVSYCTHFVTCLFYSSEHWMSSHIIPYGSSSFLQLLHSGPLGDQHSSNNPLWLDTQLLPIFLCYKQSCSCVFALLPGHTCGWFPRCQGHCFPKITFLSYFSSLKQTALQASSCRWVSWPLVPLICRSDICSCVSLSFLTLCRDGWEEAETSGHTLCAMAWPRSTQLVETCVTGCACVSVKLNKDLWFFTSL